VFPCLICRIHRDLKPENILVELKDQNIFTTIADFDLCKEFSNQESFTMCGTQNYLSPEIAKQQSYGIETDIFSLGCVFFQMLTNKTKALYTHILENEHMAFMSVEKEVSENYPREVAWFITKFLYKNPKQRVAVDGAITALKSLKIKVFNKEDTSKVVVLNKEFSNIITSEEISRRLCSTLRHKAISEGLMMRTDGFVRLDDLWTLDKFKDITMLAVKRVVNQSEKKRFRIKVEHGVSWIRAMYGHSIKVEITGDEISEDELEMLIHPTSYEHWSGVKEGIHSNGRQHIHFRTTEDSVDIKYQIMVYLDFKRMIGDGMKLYWTENQSVVSEGKDGWISNDYFLKVCDAVQGDVLYEKPSV
jgi:2'-phosphotransferase